MEESGRVYRKGNWSLHETMILIEAKKVDYSRRTQRTLKESGGGGAGSSRPQEMRWKWVEECCWKQGCHRSQNQCNDRWDNLMRDYKKVRSYEASSSRHDPASLSYWKLERHERKERSLPANLLPEIYEALSEVVQMRAAMAEKPQGGGGGGGGGTPLVAPSIDSEDSQRSISASLERKRKRGRTGEESSSHHRHHLGLGSAITKCASIIAEALQEGEEKEGMRHKDLLGIEQRKAKLEETKSQVAAQSTDGLATAVNKLATSILGLVTARVQKLQK